MFAIAKLDFASRPLKASSARPHASDNGIAALISVRDHDVYAAFASHGRAFSQFHHAEAS